MPIEVTVIGQKETTQRMKLAMTRLPQVLLETMQTQMTRLADYVRNNKLHGQVLNQRSGSLTNAVYGTSLLQGNTIVGKVGVAGIPYAIIWEKTGSKAHTIVPINAKALRFMIGGSPVFAMKASIPAQAPRPFLKPSIMENQTKIVDALRAATKGVMSAA